jgi:cytochrome b6-f complex iron-sulfur subunit
MDASRRRFLKSVAGLSGVAALGGCLPDVSASRQVRIEPTTDGLYLIDFTQAPELQTSGGAVIVASRRREVPTVLVLNDEGTYLALAGTCTHAGCPVGYQRGQIICPCHLSAFDLSGKVTHAPATQPLRTFPIELTTDGKLSVSLVAGDGVFPPPQNGQLVLPFADYPALRAPGNAIYGTPQGIISPIFVLSLAGNAFSTVSSVCTHSQCLVQFESDRDDLYCNCHGSRFTAQGAVVDGPANRPLPSYATTADDVAVTIQLS